MVRVTLNCTMYYVQAKETQTVIKKTDGQKGKYHSYLVVSLKNKHIFQLNLFRVQCTRL